VDFLQVLSTISFRGKFISVANNRVPHGHWKNLRRTKPARIGQLLRSTMSYRDLLKKCDRLET
jgi:hypothetical protein